MPLPELAIGFREFPVHAFCVSRLGHGIGSA